MSPGDWWERAREVQGLILDVDGVLTDGRLYYGRGGEQLKSFHVRDGLGLALLAKTGMRIAIISGRASEGVQARAKELQIEPCLLGRGDKLEALEEVAAAWGVEATAMAAIGDDLVDIPLLRRVGVSLTPSDGDPRLRELVDVVLAAGGGAGAVREACELLMRARGDWPQVIELYELGGDLG